MNLTIDIGNTSTKLSLHDKGSIVSKVRLEPDDIESIKHFVSENSPIESAIISNSGALNPELESWLRSYVAKVLVFDHQLQLPLINLYSTPNTLGKDRLAAAIGAITLYPGRELLIVDFGTAITIDRVSHKGEFLGGNISPGVQLRFRSLHEFTNALPLIKLDEEFSAVGDSTKNAINNGVINGIIFEIKGYIEHFEENIANLLLIFTGGDSIFFAKRFKNTIFAKCDLVEYGLNRILEHNV